MSVLTHTRARARNCSVLSVPRDSLPFLALMAAGPVPTEPSHTHAHTQTHRWLKRFECAEASAKFPAYLDALNPIFLATLREHANLSVRFSPVMWW